MRLPFVISRKGVTAPTRAYPGDAGLDLQAAEHTIIEPLERCKVTTGIQVQIPDGYVGLVVPRSGLAVKHGITHLDGPGIIDSGYRGEVHMLLYNTDKANAFEVKIGERLGQMIVVPYAALDPHHATTLRESERGSRGLGSSG